MSQDDYKVEHSTPKIQDSDLVTDSIHKIVDEILEDIGDIFIREKLFAHECKMILAALEEEIKGKDHNA